LMETDNIRSIPMINAVEGFNPASFARELQNEDGTKSLYLDVKYRLLWFRLHNPEGKIDTEVVKVDDQSAVVCCRLYPAAAQNTLQSDEQPDGGSDQERAELYQRHLFGRSYGNLVYSAGSL